MCAEHHQRAVTFLPFLLVSASPYLHRSHPAIELARVVLMGYVHSPELLPSCPLSHSFNLRPPLGTALSFPEAFPFALVVRAPAVAHSILIQRTLVARHRPSPFLPRRLVAGREILSCSQALHLLAPVLV